VAHEVLVLHVLAHDVEGFLAGGHEIQEEIAAFYHRR